MPEPVAELEFVSEPIIPERGAFDTSLMRQGLASLPGAFAWRRRRYEIVECLEHVKQSGKDMGETYLRRQSFLVRLDTGQIARIYLRRQAGVGASRTAAKQRWFLYGISPAPDDAEASSDSVSPPPPPPVSPDDCPP